MDNAILKILLSILIGGIIGAEREYRNKSAGFRTLTLISMGSCLFSLLSIHFGSTSSDRIASNIVQGIGFLCAGVIFRSDNRVSGITTAATIWITAALGMAIAAGYYIWAFLGFGCVMVVLLMFNYLEIWIDKWNQIRRYKIICHYEYETLTHFESEMEVCNLKYKRIERIRINDKITGSWMVQGSEKSHNLFIQTILKDLSIEQFEY